jgi:CBS domain-containing protein
LKGEKDMQVRDFLIHQVYTASPSTTVKELIALLEKYRIGGVPVVDKEGKLLGMISDGDIVRYLSPQDYKVFVAYYYASYVQEAQKIEDVLRDKMNTPIENIMVKKHLQTVAPDDDFEHAIRLLSKHHFKKLPVVNGAGRVVGVISRGDIIHNLSKTIFKGDNPNPEEPFTTLVKH